MICFCSRLEESGDDEELGVSENEQEEEELEEALAKAHEEDKKLNKRSVLFRLCVCVWGGLGSTAESWLWRKCTFHFVFHNCQCFGNLMM